MTIAEAVNQADKLCPNTTFSMNEKIAWLNRLDKQIKLEIMDAREGAPAFAGYTEKTPNTQELLVPSPYDELYIHYLQSQMLLYTGALPALGAEEPEADAAGGGHFERVRVL